MTIKIGQEYLNRDGKLLVVKDITMTFNKAKKEWETEVFFEFIPKGIKALPAHIFQNYIQHGILILKEM